MKGSAVIGLVFGAILGALFFHADALDAGVSHVVEVAPPAMLAEADRLQGEVSLLRGLLDLPSDGHLVSFSTPVTVTAYTARVQECDSTPWVTANMTPSRPGILAVSRDLEHELGIKFGDTVWLEGLGFYVVADRMNARWTRRVDILHASLKAAKRFSTRENVTMTWLRTNE